MTIRKRKKTRKQRGSRTYGYGKVSGGHRKSGSRGGVGKAGSKGHHRIGRIAEMIRNQRGFVVPNRSASMTINVGDIDEQLEFLTAAEIAKKEGRVFKVDINKLGYKKVLGKGLVQHPLHIHAQTITSKAQKKIEAAGGKSFPSSTTE
ncbi:MAG: uL15 family ribosomal protein [Candidatus Hodarchaeota archaeon]